NFLIIFKKWFRFAPRISPISERVVQNRVTAHNRVTFHGTFSDYTLKALPGSRRKKSKGEVRLYFFAEGGPSLSQPQYAIMRFAKYKGPEITNNEAHNERRKEKYASNPDIDLCRSKHNFHLIKPPQRYRAEAERQISDAGCRTRKVSVRVVEVLFTATPEFFKGKKLPEIRQYFEETLRFFVQYQSRETIISAVVHMDEKTAHMRLS